MEFPNKKYELIYADPPWRYDFSKSDSRKIENQYQTMELEDIKKLKIPASENAVLFLWATAPKLVEALEVMKAWGFQYKTHIIWNKKIIGMGYWCRSQHELLLIGVKGQFSPPKPEERISSIFTEKRTNHSIKPNKIRELLSKWFPNALKIELFARQNVEGWDVWGLEAPKETQKFINCPIDWFRSFEKKGGREVMKQCVHNIDLDKRCERCEEFYLMQRLGKVKDR